MRIDLFKTSPDRAGRYFVRFDNGETLRLYRQTVEDFGLYTGMELTQEEFDRLRQAASAMSAKMRAVRIISATSISKKDLESRLIQKGEKPSQAKEAIGWLEELHLLDDARTAEQIVTQCLPLLAKKLKLDPAVMASPFITTIVDALSLLLYFGVASALLL